MTIGKAFGAGDPINLVDEEGERPRIYIQNGGFGHAFITTGEGVKTTVYSYGRYGAPSDPLKETYNNPNSRAINRYSLFFQNCVTTTLSAASIGQCGIFSNAITPLELNNDLRIFNPGSVKVVNNPKVFLLELLQELWDALSN